MVFRCFNEVRLEMLVDDPLCIQLMEQKIEHAPVLATMLKAFMKTPLLHPKAMLIIRPVY